jgi:hypothetical protein
MYRADVGRGKQKEAGETVMAMMAMMTMEEEESLVSPRWRWCLRRFQQQRTTTAAMVVRTCM